MLKNVDFVIFPPPGMYIKGFPKVMFEGFIQRIDTSIQLYDIVKGQSYNQRSLSSLVNETFFGELSELEPTKLGCPKAVSIPRLMANVTEMQHFRCDPSNRVFHICTTRKSVYPKDKLLIAMDKEIQEIPGLCSPGSATMISPRNHAFDDPKLFGKRQRKSNDLIYLNLVQCVEAVCQSGNIIGVTNQRFCRQLAWGFHCRTI